MDGKEIMQMCIEYAQSSFYIPKVGAVVLDKNGNIVGFGYRQRIAQAQYIKGSKLYYGAFTACHAEHLALLQAGEKAHGGTIYVTMEPCNDRRSTPPQPKMPSCVDLIVQADISNVVFGLLDNNPCVNGRSIELLIRMGVNVEINDFGLGKELLALMVNYKATHMRMRTCDNPDFRYSGGIKMSRMITEQEEEHRKDHSATDGQRRLRMDPYKKDKYPFIDES